MNRYQAIFEGLLEWEEKDILFSVSDDITRDICSWEDGYWLSKILMSGNFDISDEKIIDILEYCFYLGLPISRREIFFDANECLAKLYIRYGMYEDAHSKLIVLDANDFSCPDWVNLYIATIYLHTITFNVIVNSPEIFFQRLLSVDHKITEVKAEVDKIFGEYLCLIVEGKYKKENVATREIIEFAEKIKAVKTEEFKLFHETICPNEPYNEEAEEAEQENDDSNNILIEDVFFKMTAWINVGIRRYLANWLYCRFINTGKKDFWSKNVKPALRPQEQERFDVYKELTDFAIDALLNIYYYNLEGFYAFHSMATADERKSIQNMQKIRNRWVGHFEENSWSKEKILADIDEIISFVEQIEMPIELKKEYLEFRECVDKKYLSQ